VLKVLLQRFFGGNEGENGLPRYKLGTLESEINVVAYRFIGTVRQYKTAFIV